MSCSKSLMNEEFSRVVAERLEQIKSILVEKSKASNHHKYSITPTPKRKKQEGATWQVHILAKSVEDVSGCEISTLIYDR